MTNENESGVERAVNVAAEAIGRTLGTIAGQVDAIRAEHPHPLDEIREAIAEGQERASELGAAAKVKVNAGLKTARKAVKSAKKAAVKTRARSKPKVKKAKKVARKRAVATRVRRVKRTVRKAVKRGRKALKRRRR